MNDASKLAGKLLFSLKLFQSFHKGYSRISWKPTCPELVSCSLWFDEKNWRCVSFKLALRVFLVKSKVGDSHEYLGQIIKSSSISRHLTIFGHYICTRRPVPSTDQALPSCFYFRITWILMEWPWNFFLVPAAFCRVSEARTQNRP